MLQPSHTARRIAYHPSVGPTRGPKGLRVVRGEVRTRLLALPTNLHHPTLRITPRWPAPPFTATIVATSLRHVCPSPHPPRPFAVGRASSDWSSACGRVGFSQSRFE